MFKKTLSEPIFRTFLYLVVGEITKDNIGEISKWVKLDKSELDFFGYSAKTMELVDKKDGSVSNLIYLKKGDIYVLAHELTHLVQQTFNRTGVENDDETFAYYYEYWFTRIFRLLQKNKLLVYN